MALDKSILVEYKQAGTILSQALAHAKTLIKVDANILEVCQAVEKKIHDLGGSIAFPAQPSIDHIAAHWCPDPGSQEVFEEGMLVKFDVGVHINGRIADSAFSVDLSDDGRHQALIRASKNARDEALKMMKPGVTLAEIGRVIQDEITAEGFSPVRNLSGHGLGEYDVHVAPSIPNFDTGDKTELEEDMVLAVEPFATPGKGKIFEQDQGNIYGYKQFKPVRSPYAREALKIIEEYNGLPFTLHWLAARMGTGQAKLALRELVQKDVLEVYPPLQEVSSGIVSQSEHSVIVADKPIVYTRE